ncbi:MAG: hypothetical protein U0572_04750 [Phycisphaerales bacterium]
MRVHVLSIALATGSCAAASAQSFDPYYAASYSFADLGSPLNVPANLGGLFIGTNDPNTLFIGGAANSMSAALYSVPLVRGADGHIAAFGGAGTTIASLHGVGGGVDGGLQYGPAGVLFYTTYPDNQLGQIKPGSGGPDLLIALAPLGVSSSVGACAFVPAGFPGAGRFKLLSYNAGVLRHDRHAERQRHVRHRDRRSGDSDRRRTRGRRLYRRRQSAVRGAERARLRILDWSSRVVRDRLERRPGAREQACVPHRAQRRGRRGDRSAHR